MYLFLESREKRKRGKETEACALTGNRSGDPLVFRLSPNPLSHTSQGSTCDILLRQPYETNIATIP